MYKKSQNMYLAHLTRMFAHSRMLHIQKGYERLSLIVMHPVVLLV